MRDRRMQFVDVFQLPLDSIHWACCLMLTGLIWVIQLVHYPSFLWIDPSKFVKFTEFHGKRISLIVIPLMVIELATAVLLCFEMNSFVWRLNLGGVLLIWASTFFISVPLHIKLDKERHEPTIKRLIITNWPRTVLWTARSIMIAGYMMRGV